MLPILQVDDGFLSEKAQRALNAYFSYLEEGLTVAGSGALAVGNEAEKSLLQRYDPESLEFRLVGSTLVTETFHVLELYTKCVLAHASPFLLFENIDEYPDRLARIEKAREDRRNKLEKSARTIAGMVKSGKTENVANKVSSMFSTLLGPTSDAHGKSVGACGALQRLTLATDAHVPEETVKDFTAFANYRNAIIHFGDFAPMLEAIVVALRSTMKMLLLAPESFPLCAAVPPRYQSKLPAHDEVFQHLMLKQCLPSVLDFARKCVSTG